MLRKKLYLVDGNSYSYRAFYAIADLRTSKGKPTGAIFGFVNMLNKLRGEASPDYVAVCFDLKGPTLRHEKFADYKVHRKPMPDDLQSQMPLIKEIISAYGIPIFQLKGYEADDIIATLAVKFRDKVDVYIVSGDKDMLQLVDKYVKIYSPQKQDAIVDEEKVFERYKVTPSQITDLLALTGDSSDNIPGVPGIGPKTAAELIGAFGSLENILKNTHQIQQEKRRQLLKDFSRQAILSKELATVICDVPVKVDLERLKTTPEDTEHLRTLFRELEFRSLYNNLASEAPRVNKDVSVDTINSRKELELFARSIEKSKELSFCLEKRDGKDSPVLEGLTISTTEKKITKIALGSKLNVKNLKECLAGVFENRKVLKISYDIKSSCVLLDKCGISLKGPFFDIMVAAYLLEPSAGTRTLADICGVFLGLNVNHSALSACQFSIRDALVKELKEKKMDGLFTDVEMPLVEVLFNMQRSGISLDKDYLCRLKKETDGKLKKITRQIYAESGGEFNINSPKQLSEILFKRFKLPIIKKGKTGPSTNVDVLKHLAGKHVLPGMVLEFRELSKLMSTYIIGLLELINPDTKKIHTSFNQTVTATGRLSSSLPNLQNIPIRTDTGRQIRAAFVSATKQSSLLCADYSQIELRVLAHLSQDKKLIQAFADNLDVHQFTAALIFDVETGKITEKMRDAAKRVNFGIIYGMGPYALAGDIGVSHEEAKKFIKEYFKRYPKVKEYLDNQIKIAREKGYVTTLLNRRRYIPQINAKNSMQRSFAERTAMNTPIQGTAADLIKIAMVNIYRALKERNLNTKMLLQVHDELVFDVPEDEMKIVKKVVKDEMEHVLKLRIPIKVSLKTGKNWRDVK